MERIRVYHNNQYSISCARSKSYCFLAPYPPVAVDDTEYINCIF